MTRALVGEIKTFIDSYNVEGADKNPYVRPNNPIIMHDIEKILSLFGKVYIISIFLIYF